jgi:outer membrane protein assembly complex protein YaeT
VGRSQTTIRINLALFLILVWWRPAWAAETGFAPADEIDARRSWRITTVDVEGLDVLQRFLYVPKLQTMTRPWWVFWRALPEFAPVDLQADASRLARELHAVGFYEARVEAEAEVLEEPRDGEPGEPGLVRGKLVVDLGERVQVCKLDIDFGALPIPAGDIRRLRKDLAIVVGQDFTEDDYQGAGQQIVDYLGEHGYAAAKVDREARVDVPRRCVAVAYTATAGDLALFGETSIEGLTEVSSELIRQEIAYERGEVYDTRKTAETVRRLRGLRLFTIVRLVPEGIDESDEAPMKLSLTEGPVREVRLGVGYSTEDGVRGLASWTHYNWLGGGRQLGFSTRISEVRRTVSANFLQPYFPAPSTKSLLNFTLGQDDESTYQDDFVRVIPRVEWRVASHVDVNFSLVGAYDSLSGVSDESKQALPGFLTSGITVAPGAGIRWIDVDDTVNPSKGLVLAAATDVASKAFGGDFGWYRLVVESRGYYPLYGELVVSTRLSGGTIVPYGSTDQIQFWDRFYAGGTGINPVRGYARRRVGPMSDSNDPIGGRSVVIGSLELRHPLFGPVQGIAFADAGDVELSAWQFQPENVQTGVGVGLRANSPVGPVELGVGFGLDRCCGDSLAEVYFNIGPNF